MKQRRLMAINVMVRYGSRLTSLSCPMGSKKNKQNLLLDFRKWVQRKMQRSPVISLIEASYQSISYDKMTKKQEKI
jgi:hypothetical protein